MHVHSGLTPTRRPGPVGGDEPQARPADDAEGNRGADGGASASDPEDQYAALDPLALYKTLYEESCYDCREMKRRDDVTRNATWRCTAGSLRVRLCKSCSELYAYKPRGRMRLVTFGRCKDDWCLRPKDLEGLPYGLDTNPENASWAPMKLYRRVDVLERANDDALSDAERAQAQLWLLALPRLLLHIPNGVKDVIEDDDSAVRTARAALLDTASPSGRPASTPNALPKLSVRKLNERLSFGPAWW